MKILYYPILIVAFLIGYEAYPYVILLPLALAATLVLMPARYAQIKAVGSASPQPLLREGIFLFFMQLLILFCISGVGYLFSLTLPAVLGAYS